MDTVAAATLRRRMHRCKMDDCQKLRGADGEMPLLEEEPADLAYEVNTIGLSIKLADEVKRLKSELAVCKRQYKFHGLMDTLVLHMNLARQNAALTDQHRETKARLKDRVCIEPRITMWHTLDQSEMEYVHAGGALDDEDWETFVEKYQERFSEQCNLIGYQMFSQFCGEIE
jgi:hypothetical protein